MQSAHLAIDLGASSGRAVLGLLEGDSVKLRVEEVHRFAHTPIETPVGPVWDFTGIANHVFTGLQAGSKAASEVGATLSSIGVDSWGVDCGVIGPSGELTGLPRCYRHPANGAARDRVLQRLEGGVDELYRRNGIQPLPFNTLFQACGRLDSAPELVPDGGRLLLMSDLLHYWLSGELSNERTNASTGSWLSVDTADWDFELLDTLSIPRGLLGPICDAGTRLGRLRRDLAENLDVSPEIEVVVPATHDTASAVAAVPVTGRDIGSWAYLSSGTWSLLGAELPEPIATPEALAAGFTNELGVCRNGKPTVRFLRNIGGLWLIQELQRDLERNGQSLGFAELASLAEDSEPFRTVVDPNAEDLAAPGESIEKLQAHARTTGQPIPKSPGQLARCCLESLALCYAETLDRIEQVSGRSIEVLHAVGGGTQNQLLNRLTAAAIDRPLYVGPVEATAIGNLLVQAMGLGAISGLDELREVVARSFPPERVEAQGAAQEWEEPRRRYAQITSNVSSDK